MSMELSTKFKSDLVKFFEWVEVANYIIKKGDTDLEWSLNLNKDFKEPARNKLAIFIEELMKKYSIFLNDNEIIDAKQFVKNFKDYKPIKKNKKSANKTSPEKLQRKSKRSNNLDKKCCSNIKLDNNLDSSSNGMLCQLSQSTEELEKVFGCKPENYNQDNCRYQWKFTMDNVVYSVYDWAYEDNTFDDYQDSEWFLGGDDDSVGNIKTIRDFLSRRTNVKIVKSDEFISDSEYEFENVNNILEL